ncbi:DUF4349 domain-containing protein [Streptomyces griseoaurantiacus]|uniref:DUF4349 domain-containing protein n=1 Tax=Streptomyces griseoaurantiacus TaxID=68213 RepID=A0A7W2DQ78_9ACTN|nr:DUF4349 domain-containing protein [Streptomyces griseoaurantiacus]MBA5220727.1 DUF4349 domain-containing protein [Streptomyces griseoaurantiacus]
MRTTTHPRRRGRRTRSGTRPSGRLPAAVLLGAALVLAGCSADSGDSGADAAGGKAAAPGAEAGRQGAAGSAAARSGGTAGPGASKPAPSSVVRTASLTVRVKNMTEALDTARTAARDAGGFVGDENTRRDEDGSRHSEIVLRVPTEKYDEVLGELEGTGELLRRNSKAEDVTDQVVDVDSRVKSQRASVARVRKLMDRATELSDVVSLESELGNREADLEALLAQQASLKDRVGLATVTLTLSEKTAAARKTAAAEDDPGFLDALAGGWGVFLAVLRWIALVVGALLPFLVVFALGAVVWRRVLRPRLPRRPAPVTSPAAPGTLPSAPPARDGKS